MEAGRQLLPSTPLFSKSHFTNPPPSSISMLHEQAAIVVTSTPTTSTTSTTQHFPASVLLQEQRDEFRTLLHVRDDKTLQLTPDRRHMEFGASVCEEQRSSESDQYRKDFENQLLYWPGFLPSSYQGDKPASSMIKQSFVTDTDRLVNNEPSDALSLAQKAVMASKQAASLIEESNLLADVDESISGLRHSSSDAQIPLENEIKVGSRRLVERRAKKRKASKPKSAVVQVPYKKKESKHPNIDDAYDPNDPLRLFLSGSETRQLLSAKEEKELFVRIQELTKLEVVKEKLHSQSGHEPTLVEWADAVGMSCPDLQSYIQSGQRSREKMTYANFRMVVHVAKHYQGRGLILQDLLQEGSKGLMRSIEKFKPQAGCKFSTYAYWWIRQSIRKAIFQNSRMIRLPENVYHLLLQVRKKRILFIQEGRQPTNDELAESIGITVEKLESLLHFTRSTLSMQQKVWADDPTTYQDVTADPQIETPDVSVSKQLMRQHVRNLLGVLSPKERRIIRLRYGIEGGQPTSLSQIGIVFGISKERVRQLESRAMEKLKKCLSSHGLDSYGHMLI